MNPLLSIENLSVDFSSEKQILPAVKNISFTVERGRVTAIVGESGSGKTVTSLSILQLLPSPPAQYRSGKILFSEEGKDSVDLLKMGQGELKKIRGNKIGMIFQEPMSSLNPVFTCGSQVMEAILAHKNLSRTEARQLAMEWFDKVKLPDPAQIFRRFPHQISGGQKQRVMIAMAMCCNPSVLICDEPTTALDVTVQKTILALLRDLQEEQNIGIIFISHDLSVVSEIADKIIVMYQGEMVEQNSVKEIFMHPTHPYTKALLACRPAIQPRGSRLPVVSDFLGNSSLEQPVKNQVVLTPAAIPALEAKPDKVDPLVEVRNLSVWFPSRKNIFGKTLNHLKAVDDVSFVIKKGETMGLVGESGCGKTTLGRAMLRLIDPTSGKILYGGEDLTNKPRKELTALRKEIQIIFQDPYSSLNPRMTIGSAIAEPMQVHGMFPTRRERRDKVIELLKKMDLKAEHFSRYPHEFSGGQRQRIVIARALALNPSFIVCDEPVSALDVSVQAQVLNLLNDLKKEFHFTILFISHDLSVVRFLCDTILVMNKGKIEERGPADEIYFRPQEPYTKKLIDSIPGGMIA